EAGAGRRRGTGALQGPGRRRPAPARRRPPRRHGLCRCGRPRRVPRQGPLCPELVGGPPRKPHPRRHDHPREPELSRRRLSENAGMSLLWILLPLFVEVALTFALMFWLGVERVAVVRRKEIHIRDMALGQPNWPKRA